jgi:hypothetical protein
VPLKPQGQETAACCVQPAGKDNGHGTRTFTKDEIAKRAYAIWEREGKKPGLDQQNWDKAIKELSSGR